jgi:hypothetical protein
MREYDRRIALGSWGEKKALVLLDRAGFSKVRDVNVETFNHPFGDIYAERAGKPYLIGVKTRNKFRDIGLVNGEYNIQKKGVDVQAIALPYKAELAWITIQVIPELQTFSSYFGTIALINEHYERFSIPMRATETSRYERLASEETDSTISPQWSNGGYGRSRD